jgi:MFS superfamily sulfate permease-like transporter
VLLSGSAIALIVFFGGDTHALIPLYSVGVFVSFTLSQGGMVRHWLRDRVTGWRWRLSINAVGAAMTGVVLVVVLVAKAPTSLAVAVVIPALVSLMLFIERQYRHAREHLRVRPDLVFAAPSRHERVVIPVPALTRAVVQAVQFGRSISDDVVAVHVNEDLAAAEEIRDEFERQLPGVPFVIVESPYRAVVAPFVRYLDVTTTDSETMTLVVIPEYVARHWWERILYNQTSARLRKELLGRPHTVVANVPYRREDPVFMASGPGAGGPTAAAAPADPAFRYRP